MKRVAMLVFVLFLLASPLSAAAPLYTQPIKRLTADEIFGTLMHAPFNRDIREWVKNEYTPPTRKDVDNWVWEHKENGTLLRMYFNPSNIIYCSAIQEIAYSIDDATARTEILAGQYERRFGPPAEDTHLENNLHVRRWNINNVLIFTMLTKLDETNIMYLIEPVKK